MNQSRVEVSNGLAPADGLYSGDNIKVEEQNPPNSLIVVVWLTHFAVNDAGDLFPGFETNHINCRLLKKCPTHYYLIILILARTTNAKDVYVALFQSCKRKLPRRLTS